MFFRIPDDRKKSKDSAILRTTRFSRRTPVHRICYDFSHSLKLTLSDTLHKVQVSLIRLRWRGGVGVKRRLRRHPLSGLVYIPFLRTASNGVPLQRTTVLCSARPFGDHTGSWNGVLWDKMLIPFVAAAICYTQLELMSFKVEMSCN
jgi:hypothetical protein